MILCSDEGISREGDILDLAANTNVVNKSGAWYAYNGEKIGQGRKMRKKFLKENPEICQEIEAKVRAYYHLDGETAETEEHAVTEPSRADDIVPMDARMNADRRNYTGEKRKADHWRPEGGLSFPLYEKEAAKYRLTEGGTLTRSRNGMKYAVKFWKSGQNDGLCTFCSAWSARSVSFAGNCRRTVIRKKSWSVPWIM